jgi:hypothetical protein
VQEEGVDDLLADEEDELPNEADMLKVRRAM